MKLKWYKQSNGIHVVEFAIIINEENQVWVNGILFDSYESLEEAQEYVEQFYALIIKSCLEGVWNIL